MIINSLNVRKGASWRIMFKTIPQTSMEQQQSEQQVFDLEDCQEHEKQNKIINVQRMALWVRREMYVFTLHQSPRRGLKLRGVFETGLLSKQL